MPIVDGGRGMVIDGEVLTEDVLTGEEENGSVFVILAVKREYRKGMILID